MGARINYVFKDDTDTSVVLYSHWGQTDWVCETAGALEHSRARWGDTSYATRMMISYFIRDSILDETGFGIYAINNVGSMDLGEQTVVIDVFNNNVDGKPFLDFIVAADMQVFR
jgi:hypothetical protein